MNEAVINNDFYEELGDRWYDDDTHIIALLRAESRLKVAYVHEVFRREGVKAGARVLDIGCGAGLIANPLAEAGYELVGIDQSASSLETARRRARPGTKVHYAAGDAYRLDFPDHCFDAVMLLDFLEHVEEPSRALKEAMRVLRPGGVLLFYTFNRTFLAGLLAVKAVSFIARDCPKNFHLLRLFIKPKELEGMLAPSGFAVKEYRGLRPRIGSWAFWNSLFTRRVHPDFGFVYTSRLDLGYMGFAKWS